MQYDFRLVSREEIPLIEKLFQETYNRVQGIDFWDWMFDTPMGYVPVGIFDNGNLIGYYAGIMRNECATAYSAMINKSYRKQGLFTLLAEFLYSECEKRGAKYVYLFDNQNIHHIHINQCGLIPDRQIKEYRLDYNADLVHQFISYYPVFQTDFARWRYAQHPHHQGENTRYIYYSTLNGKANQEEYHLKEMAFSTFEDRVQILSFSDLKDALGMAMLIAFILHKKQVAFWCEQELDYPYVMLPTWRMYKLLDNTNLEFVKNHNKILRMYQSDVF